MRDCAAYLCLPVLPPAQNEDASSKLQRLQTSIALLLAFQFGFAGLAERISETVSTRDLRWSLVSITAKAAKDYFPFGSGIGTFAPIYQRYEPLNICRSRMSIGRIMTGWSHGSRAAWPMQWSLLRFSPVTSFWPIEAGAQPIQICARLHTRAPDRSVSAFCSCIRSLTIRCGRRLSPSWSPSVAPLCYGLTSLIPALRDKWDRDAITLGRVLGNLLPLAA